MGDYSPTVRPVSLPSLTTPSGLPSPPVSASTGTDIIRFSHGASSSNKVYRSSFIPGLHDVCMILNAHNHQLRKEITTMTTTATKTYLVGVIERAISYYEVEAQDARTAAENWQEGEFWDRDDEALESEGPCRGSSSPTAHSGSCRDRNGRLIRPEASAARNPFPSCYFTPTTPTTVARRPTTPSSKPSIRSTPLPGHSGRPSLLKRGRQVRRRDFAPLLVTQGHHYSEALFNK